MKENWEKSFDEVMLSEGGFVLHDVSGDLGGQTYAGIARKPNPDWEGWALIDRSALPSKNMVMNFYRDRFWNAVKGDDLPSGVDYLVYDFAVNAGVWQSSKLLQRAVNVYADGVIGNMTLTAVKEKDTREIIDSFTKNKEQFYDVIIKMKPEQIKFYRGWMNRVNHSKDMALKFV